MNLAEKYSLSISQTDVFTSSPPVGALIRNLILIRALETVPSIVKTCELPILDPSVKQVQILQLF